MLNQRNSQPDSLADSLPKVLQLHSQRAFLVFELNYEQLGMPFWLVIISHPSHRLWTSRSLRSLQFKAWTPCSVEETFCWNTFLFPPICFSFSRFLTSFLIRILFSLISPIKTDEGASPNKPITACDRLTTEPVLVVQSAECSSQHAPVPRWRFGDSQAAVHLMPLVMSI